MVLIVPHSLISDKACVIYTENYQSESQLEPAACQVLLIFSVLPADGKVPENRVLNPLF